MLRVARKEYLPAYVVAGSSDPRVAPGSPLTPGSRRRIGCTFQYVSDRHTHSTGPNRKYFSQIGLTINLTAHTPATTQKSW